MAFCILCLLAESFETIKPIIPHNLKKSSHYVTIQ